MKEFKLATSIRDYELNKVTRIFKRIMLGGVDQGIYIQTLNVSFSISWVLPVGLWSMYLC